VIGQPVLGHGVAVGEVRDGDRPAVEAEQPPVEQRTDVADGGIGGSDERVERQGALVADQCLPIVRRGRLEVIDGGRTEDCPCDENQDQDRAELEATMTPG
jgi:hypothetical protein